MPFPHILIMIRTIRCIVLSQPMSVTSQPKSVATWGRQFGVIQRFWHKYWQRRPFNMVVTGFLSTNWLQESRNSHNLKTHLKANWRLKCISRISDCYSKFYVYIIMLASGNRNAICSLWYIKWDTLKRQCLLQLVLAKISRMKQL